jgi:hypothetical protein
MQNESTPTIVEMLDGFPNVEELTEFVERNMTHFEYLRDSGHVDVADTPAAAQPEVQLPPVFQP